VPQVNPRQSTTTQLDDLLSAVADRLGGQRVKASIDRRISAQLSARLAPDQGLLDQALTRPPAQQAIAEQVALREASRVPDQLRINRDFTADVFFGTGSRYERLLTPRRYRLLGDEITKLTQVKDVEWPMRQAYRTLLDHESRGLGRMAGSTYNIIGKLVVPVLLQPPPAPLLEIGTLFGLFSPALVRQFRRAGHFPHLTVIDPLEGIQIQPELGARDADPTGTPVTATIAEHNLRQCALGPDEFRIIQGFSTDPVARSQVADRSYGVVIIDGDHSEAGVYEDLCWVQDLVEPGGIVVMDDFGDPRWTGVERAGHRYLADGGRLELLGTASTSAYLTRR